MSNKVTVAVYNASCRLQEVVRLVLIRQWVCSESHGPAAHIVARTIGPLVQLTSYNWPVAWVTERERTHAEEERARVSCNMLSFVWLLYVTGVCVNHWLDDWWRDESINAAAADFTANVYAFKWLQAELADTSIYNTLWTFDFSVFQSRNPGIGHLFSPGITGLKKGRDPGIRDCNH